MRATDGRANRRERPGHGDWMFVLVPLAAVFGPVVVIYLLAELFGW
ncbi:MAG: hypothetical protein ACREUW_08470 [Burkholderiales bacterium]